jgi:uncharacterized protein YegP (UPF0339 family)
LDEIESVKKNSQVDAHYKREVSKKGQDFFHLDAANGQIIGISKENSSKSAMKDAITIVKRIGPTSEAKDLILILIMKMWVFESTNEDN